MIPRLAALRELGVTAIELMPVATFPGDRGWGYDGALHLRAASARTAGRTGSRASSTPRTAQGLGVILDVVYNHIGPGSEAIGALRPVLHRPPRDLLGRRARLLAARRARMGDPERRALDARLRDRRPAPRRRARDLRRLASRTSSPSCATRVDGLVISRDELRRLAPARRVGPRRDVARQPPPRAARAPDRRARRATTTSFGVDRRPRARARRARGRSGSSSARRTTTRSATARSATGCRRTRTASRSPCVLFSLEHAAPLHGRGVRRAAAVPVLHRPHRPGDRRGDARGRQARVRAFTSFSGERGAGPAGASRRSSARSSSRASRRPALPRAARAAARRSRASSTSRSTGSASTHAPRRPRRSLARLRREDRGAAP